MKSSSEIETKHLYKFLRKHCCLDKCIKNILAYEAKQKWVIKYLDDGDILKLLSHYDNISTMFIWRNTDEGQDFWERLDNLHHEERLKFINLFG